MSSKIKIMFSNFSICYMIIVIILTINSVLSTSTKINIAKINSLSKDYQDLEIRINNLESGKCKSTLNKLLNISKNNTFQGEINLREMNKIIKKNKIISEYINAKKNCNIPDKVADKLGIYAVSAATTYDNIINEHLFDYELKILDKETRLIGNSTYTNIRFRTAKMQEIELINKIIEVYYEQEK